MSHAVGTSLRDLPWFVRRGVARYSPHVIRTRHFHDGDPVGEEEVVVQMDVTVTDDLFGGIAAWWLPNNGWPVDFDDGRIIAYVDVRPRRRR